MGLVTFPDLVREVTKQAVPLDKQDMLDLYSVVQDIELPIEALPKLVEKIGQDS